MLKKLLLLCFSIVVVVIFYFGYYDESMKGSLSPLIESNELDVKNSLKKTSPEKPDYLCDASLYRVINVRKSLKSPLIINSKSVEEQLADTILESDISYESDVRFMRMLSDATKSKEWDVVLSSIRQGEIPIEGTFSGRYLSLFDVVIVSLPPQEVISELIELNITPTMFSFEFFSQFKHLGSSMLTKLERYYSPDIDYRVKYKGEELNLATFSSMSKNIKALEFWQSKGLNIEQDKLSNINSDKIEKLNENNLMSTQTTIMDSAGIEQNNYNYFTLMKVMDCKNTNSIKVIDMIPNDELDKIFEGMRTSDTEKLIYLDEINPLYTEVFLNKKRPLIEYPSTEVSNVVNDLDDFIKNVKNGIFNKDLRIYSSSPKNGLTILDFSLFFGLESEFISYLFGNNFPISLDKLAYTLASKQKREKVFELLASNYFDFDQVENGKSLLHYAIKTGNTDLILYLKAKGIPLIEKFGVDALEYTLRDTSFKDQYDILGVISDFYPTLEARHYEILNNIKQYEPERYKLLIKRDFLVTQAGLR